MEDTMQIFNPSFDLGNALRAVRERGYFFAAQAMSETVCLRLQQEIDSLPLEVGDHIAHPIQAGAPTEVRQLHARAYRQLDNPGVGEASWLCRALAEAVYATRVFSEELSGWLLNEIGYQRYRGARDHISPHRDRRSDQCLSVTVTISGSAWVRIHRALTDPPDYRQLELMDVFLTGPGSIMLLRAPGFGSGEQVIHEVMPSEVGVRDIVNLRMRPTLLPPPGKERVV